MAAPSSAAGVSSASEPVEEDNDGCAEDDAPHQEECVNHQLSLQRDRALALGRCREVAEQRKKRWQPGDPAATRSAILKIVDADKPPLRVFFGDAPLAMAKADYASRIALWEEWNPVAIEAQGSKKA